MDANGIIGREYEQKLIQERCKSNKAELIAIYGRRRVGKTFLVRKMFNDQFAFSFIGMYEVSRAVQLEQFRMALAQYAKQTMPKLKTWFEAFAAFPLWRLLRNLLRRCGGGFPYSRHHPNPKKQWRCYGQHRDGGIPSSCTRYLPA